MDMKVSDIIRIGDKIDIRVLQEVEQAEKTDVTVKTYKSKVLDFCSNGNMEIAMPMEAGKLVLLQLGVRYVSHASHCIGQLARLRSGIKKIIYICLKWN
jgi:c-di-GMP-binding flagellar brake protein YcgR